MFDLEQASTTQRAIDAFIYAQTDSHVRRVFPHKVTQPYSRLLTYYGEVVEAFYHGKYLDYVSAEWLIQKNINTQIIEQSKKHDTFFSTLTDCFINYASIQHSNTTSNIVDFTFNESWHSSTLLHYLHKLLLDKDLMGIYSFITHKYTKELSTISKKYSGNALQSAIKMVQWYRNTIPMVKLVSRGTIETSPLCNEQTFIAHMFAYMERHGLLYPNSPLFLQWKEAMSVKYHIKWEGQAIQEVKGDYDYKHVAKVIPKGILQGGYK
jgi:hypothetical protein